MPYTFANLKAEIRPIIFPAREAGNLRVAHDKMFVEALVDIQRMVECFQYNNTAIYPQCSTLFQCGMTVITDIPRGAIKHVYVVDRINPTTLLEDSTADIDWCCRVDYSQVHKCDMERYVSLVGSGCGSCGTAMYSVFGFSTGDCGCKSFPAPTNAGWENWTTLPMGLNYPNSSTDSTCGRARRGVWAMERGRIYIAPWIQSTETVVVEWDGIKRTWDDADVLEDDPTLKRAVRYFVAAGHAKDYDRDESAYSGFRRDYDEAIRDLIWECRQETMVRACEDSHARQSTAELDIREEVTTTTTSTSSTSTTTPTSTTSTTSTTTPTTTTTSTTSTTTPTTTTTTSTSTTTTTTTTTAATYCSDCAAASYTFTNNAGVPTGITLLYEPDYWTVIGHDPDPSRCFWVHRVGGVAVSVLSAQPTGAGFYQLTFVLSTTEVPFANDSKVGDVDVICVPSSIIMDNGSIVSTI